MRQDLQKRPFSGFRAITPPLGDCVGDRLRRLSAGLAARQSRVSGEVLLGTSPECAASGVLWVVHSWIGGLQLGAPGLTFHHDSACSGSGLRRGRAAQHRRSLQWRKSSIWIQAFARALLPGRTASLSEAAGGGEWGERDVPRSRGSAARYRSHQVINSRRLSLPQVRRLMSTELR